MKRVLYNIKAKALRTFGECEKLQMLIKHLKNVRTLMEEDEGEIYEKVTRIGDDHLACCLAYAYIGVDGIKQAHKPRTNLSWDFI